MAIFPVLILLLAAGVAANPQATGKVKCAAVKQGCTSKAAATSWCSSYFGIHDVIETSFSAKTITKTRVRTTTFTSHSTETITVTDGTSTARATVAYCPGDPNDFPASSSAVVKRQAAPPPACLMSYTNGASLSSACNCYSLTAKTKTTTVRSGTSTILTTSTSTITTVGEPYTTTQTVKATVQSPVPPPPDCNSATVTNDGDGPNPITYNLYYTGCNVQDSFRSPASTRFWDGELGMCAAVIKCAQEAAAGSDKLSFALYHRRTGGADFYSGRWQCDVFQEYNSDGSVFDAHDDDILQVYAFAAE